jgi:hypothetical protein
MEVLAANSALTKLRSLVIILSSKRVGECAKDMISACLARHTEEAGYSRKRAERDRFEFVPLLARRPASTVLINKIISAKGPDSREREA